MPDWLKFVLGLLGMLLFVLPIDLLGRGLKNLRDAWTGKSKNIRKDEL